METLYRFFSKSTRQGIVFATFAFVTIVFAVSTAFAGGGPENVVLVVNADSASSKMLANYYIHGRQIPARNVIYLNDVPAKETTHEVIFRDKIIKPILEELDLRKLTGTVDYIIYSSDFPSMVIIDKHFRALKEKVKKETGQTLPVKVYTPRASLTSMTFFAAATHNDNPGYIALDSNTYYRQPASGILRRPFMGETQDQFQKATQNVSGGTPKEIDASIETLKKILQQNPRQVAVAYWLARRFAQKGDKRNATNALTLAIRLGWVYRRHTQVDRAFDGIIDDPVFKGVVDRIADEPFDFVPTRGFKNKYSWGVNGFLNAEPNQGNRYFLSSILGVTRNHGNTEKDALRQLKRTMAADSSHPEGTFYFTDTSDVRIKARRGNYDKAIAALKNLGKKVELVTTKMPMKARDIVGLTCGTAQFNWTATGSKIVPGAFCDNLTSYGGTMYRAGQTKLTEFLTQGAAGASGTVVEPYAIQAKFPHPMVHVHYARGCSLAEAYYQSVAGPFQLLLVGDGLCQPWATKPELKVDGIAAGDEIKDKIKITLDASKSPVPIEGYELYVDGVVVHRTLMKNSLSLDTTGMTDGYHEIRIVAIAGTAIESTHSVILPIRINNHDKVTSLSTEHPDYVDTDTIKFVSKSNYGDSIELMHNGRSIAKKIGQDAVFEIPAKLLGRGPVQLEALSISEAGRSVASMPISLQINGLISERKVDTETKPKKKQIVNPKARK